MKTNRVLYSLIASTALFLAMPAASAAPAAKWSYEGKTGPAYWGSLDAAYLACSKGLKQSPVNIEWKKVTANPHLSKLTLQYKPTVLSLLHDGHTIAASPSAPGSILIGQTKYDLKQFHFHTPSEHQFNGHNLEMEIHFVHKNAAGQTAVLAVMVKEGAANPALDRIWDILPKEIGQTIQTNETVNLLTLLPKKLQTFRYEGSLTTPPCTEGVQWLVLKEPLELSRKQIQVFRSSFPDNHRPVQPLNMRHIFKK